MGQLKDEIFKITAFLNRKNKPLEVLDKQDDIFILSPAGSGKTTTLKWFAYKLTYQVVGTSSGTTTNYPQGRVTEYHPHRY